MRKRRLGSRAKAEPEVGDRLQLHMGDLPSKVQWRTAAAGCQPQLSISPDTLTPADTVASRQGCQQQKPAVIGFTEAPDTPDTQKMRI
jgi:hypothetical protein